MAILAEYHKPQTLAEALDLLADNALRRVPLAGGTHLVAALETRQRQDVDGVVDLAGLDLAFIERDESHLRVGAMATLSALVEHPLCVTLAGGILPRTARFEGPQNLCNAATVGGLVALAEPDSELYGALLALDAAVAAVDREGRKTFRSLDAYSANRSRRAGEAELISEIRISLAPSESGHARIARTPMDRCIVAAVAVNAADGVFSQPSATDQDGARLVFCGVGGRPLLADGALNPAGDFKGSAEYRLAMSDVVRQRALTALNGAP